jgi:hypothetical protein
VGDGLYSFIWYASAGAGQAAVSVSDRVKILLTSALTILGGITVFVLGQLLSKFVIEPIQELKKAIGETRFNLAFFAPIIHTPISRTPDRQDEAYAAVMRSSCNLFAKAEAIAFYRFIPKRFLPPIADVRKAAIGLRALSTYLHETGDKAINHIEQVNARVKSIENLLRLGPLE